MAFNSDGYIMIDFTDVDFRRTNQTIEGLYKRCVDVIGTNKFILVINANGRTPLPATCSFTNNQYVIDTVIYMFAVSSNDNLFIRRNDVPASDIIDDSSISVNKTWSSNKIDSELDTKADTSALADYQPLLTAGDNITINNDVISAKGIKSFTYEGDGEYVKNITFPEIPTYILTIQRKHTGDSHYEASMSDIIYNYTQLGYVIYKVTNGTTVALAFNRISYNNNIMTISNASSAGQALNTANIEYTVYYI